jgi:uncharacterized protein (DUF934 family)
MRKLLRQREIVEDDWQYLGEEPPGGSESIIVPLAELRDNAATWRAWRGRLGVKLAPADRVEQLTEDLPRLALIAIEFPTPSEGRGYTQGRLLRERYRFTGELRALGAIKRDQIFFLTRCGFDTFELAADEDLEGARASLSTYSAAYQHSPALASIRHVR